MSGLLALALRQRFIGESADLLVEALLRHRIVRARIFRHFARHRAAFGFPFVAAAIEDFHFLVSEKPKGPERIAGPPVGFVAVKNAGRLRRDAVAAAELGEFFRRDVVANHRVLQIGPPIDVDRAGNMPGIIEQDVFVRLDDANVVIVEMFFEPIGIHQCLGMRVVGLRFPYGKFICFRVS